MRTGYLCQFVCRRSGWVVMAWLVIALLVGLTAPDLTRLVAETQTRLLPDDAESIRAAALVRGAWPDQSSAATVVVALHRPAGLTDADCAYARDLARRFQTGDRPRALLRVLGPQDRPQVANRLVSPDGTVQLLVARLDTAFLSPASDRAIQWLQAGLEKPCHRWDFRCSGPVTRSSAVTSWGAFASRSTARRCAQSSCYWGFSWSCTGRSGWR